MKRLRATTVAAAFAAASLALFAPSAQAYSTQGHHARIGSDGFGHSATSLAKAGRVGFGHPHLGKSKTLSDKVVLPFSIALAGNHVYYSEGFGSTINKLTAYGAPKVLATGPQGDGDVAGLDVAAGGRTMAFTSSNGDHSTTTLTIRTMGKRDVVADISGYEAAHNPDGRIKYGILAGGNPCAVQILSQLSETGSATYKGLVDSHPYAVTRIPGGWAVADAGANAIFKVSNTGKVSTLSVIPAQKVTLTQKMVDGLAASMGSPPGSLNCIVGVTYGFEAVPTDVETGWLGKLYVSTLPGGPEDPSLGARGSVYAVSPWGGWSYRVATGFLGATDLAVAQDGSIYVTEFFGGKIAKIRHGHVTTAAKANAPLSLEVRGNYLYVGNAGDVDFETGQVLSPGSIQKIRR